MDELAAEGIRFAQAVTPVPMTLPSHATMMTGLYPPNHGVRNNGHYRLPEAATTLAERFAAAGYRTAAFVSSFVLYRQFGLSQGFQAYDDSLFNERRGRETVRRALEWIARDDRRPYFVWVHLFEPHTPWNPPPPYDLLVTRSVYDREVAAADAFLRELLEGLPVDPALEHTVVVVLGDHGEGLNDHGELEHGIFLYGEVVRIPWILRLPGGREGGRVVQSLVCTVDLAPTLLELAGLDPPERTDGLSLVPLLEGEPGEVARRRGVYLETLYPKENFGWAPLYGYRSPRWKWIRAPESELYRLTEDPHERRNLAAAYPDTARRLDNRLQHQILRFQPLAPATGAPLSREAEERLKSLGYLSAGSLGEASEEADLPDPKAMIASHADLQEAKVAMDEERYGDAIAPFRRVLAHQERNLVAWLGLGQALNHTGRYEEAQEAYEKALELDPENATASLGLADAFFGQEKWTAALRLYEKARKDPSTRRKVESRYAAALFRMGRRSEARRHLEEAARRYPRDAAYFRKKLELLDRAARVEEALGRARSLSPAVRDSLREALVQAAWNLGWVRETHRLLSQRAATAEGERRRRRFLESLYERLDRPQEALEALEAVMELEGRTPELLLKRIRLLLAAHEDRAALEVSEELDPADLEGSDRALLHELRARALSRLGDVGGALRELRAAVAAGYQDLGRILNDAAFAPVRRDPRFLGLADSLSRRLSAQAAGGQRP
jgi:tetratricopeptide (TPR) repeat protein